MAQVDINEADIKAGRDAYLGVVTQTHNHYHQGEAQRKKDCMNALYLTDPRTDRAKLIDVKGKAVQGTCQWISRVEEFKLWLESSTHLLWVSGGPGKGKTFLSIYLAQSLPAIANDVALKDQTPPLILEFFCTKGRSTATAVLRGLLYQLLTCPNKDHLYDYILDKFEALRARNDDLFSVLQVSELWTIFANMICDKSLPQIYFVLDGLDECDAVSIEFLKPRLEAMHSVSNIRTIVVSRKLETDIQNAIRIDLDTNYRLKTGDDLKALVSCRVKDLFPKLHGDDSWRESLETTLLERAEGTFLWVGLALQALRGKKRVEVQAMLESKDSIDKWLPKGLDAMYDRILLEIPESEREVAAMTVRWISMAFRSLTVVELSIAMGVKPSRDISGEILMREHIDSFERRHLISLTEGEEVQLIHLSLKDYLLRIPSLSISTSIDSPLKLYVLRFVGFMLGLYLLCIGDTKGSTSILNFLGPFEKSLPSNLSKFSIQVKGAHQDIFVRCLEIMEEHLGKDMCDLRMPGVLASEVQKSKVNKCLPTVVQYACRYWVDHLERTDQSERAINVQQDRLGSSIAWRVHKFLQKNFLHWLEALSLMGNMPDAVVIVRKLGSIFTLPPNSPLLAMIRDSERFVLYNRSVIELAPLQTYCSALVFAPKTSIIRSHFQDQIPKWIHSVPMAQEDWSPLEHELKAHKGRVVSVSFSPDVEKVLEGYSGQLISLMFSPDGSKLASGSEDGRVRIWNVNTWQIEKVLETHWVRPTSIRFSPEVSGLESGSKDKSVPVGSVATSQVKTAFGHRGGATSVHFSPDGSKLAATYEDNSVRIWNVNTSQIEKVLEGYRGWPASIGFSPDGSKLASGSKDKSVWIWNITTWQVEKVLEGHRNWITHINFSPDGSKVASGSEDGSVRVWNMTTWNVEIKFKGFHPSSCVVFSPDGSKLASGSKNHVVLIRNVSTWKVERVLKGQGFVRHIAFSPDSSKLASAHDDKTVRVWDITISQGKKELEDHQGRVRCIAFSADNSKLASGSDDKTIRIWNAKEGQVEKVFKGRSGWATSVSFSPDGKKLASGDDDNILRIWNVKTGQIEKIFDGHKNSITSTTFSPDGKKIASGDDDNMLRTSDVKKERFEKRPGGHRSKAKNSITFSPDGSKLAWEHGNMVQIWNVAKGQVEKVLDGHLGWNRSITFSTDITISDSLYHLDHLGVWITRGGLRVLYLPVEYRPTLFTVMFMGYEQSQIVSKGDRLAIGASSGRVTIIVFRSNVNIEICK